jgi:hypothetical protein
MSVLIIEINIIILFSIGSIEQNKHFQNKKKLKVFDEIKLIISKKKR